MNKNETGRAGEEYAARYLKRRGYLIIAKNYAVRGGELDIVALKRRTLVFAEVKTRSSTDYGSAAFAVDARKQSRIKTAQRDFLDRFGKGGKVPHYFLNIRFLRTYKRCRYDIIEVYFSDDQVRVVHTEDAFK